MLKLIKTVVPAPRSHWVGDGFHVYPIFNNKAFTAEVSPFLMLDYAAPKYFKPTEQKLGVGQHPHRGFETVTIAFQGEVEHGDSLGNRGVITEGDVQWMTAGRGIIHEEFHSRKMAKTGGTFEMIQLWVNLPAEHKMTAPQYQPITKEQIPEVPFIGEPVVSCDASESKSDSDGVVKVFAGEYQGVKGPARTFTPIGVYDITFECTGKVLRFEVPEGHNTIVVVRQGSAVIGGEEGRNLGPQSVALMHDEGSLLYIHALEPQTKVFLLTGERINEPIAARGPFVMNTNEELRDAMMDFHSGRMGQ
jgi:redox-sensitive bicupin YhaK (pirin superfamily)